jgi:hypothetical protein
MVEMLTWDRLLNPLHEMSAVSLHRSRRVPEEEPLHYLASLGCRSESKHIVLVIVFLQVSEYCLAFHDGDD